MDLIPQSSSDKRNAKGKRRGDKPKKTGRHDVIKHNDIKVCPLCQSGVKLFFINFNEKFLMCENAKCAYPFGYAELQFVEYHYEYPSFHQVEKESDDKEKEKEILEHLALIKELNKKLCDKKDLEMKNKKVMKNLKKIQEGQRLKRGDSSLLKKKAPAVQRSDEFKVDIDENLSTIKIEILDTPQQQKPPEKKLGY